MPTCGGGVTPDFSLSPYCLPDDYNKDIVPPTDGKPLHINVDIWVFEVSLFILHTVLYRSLFIFQGEQD